MSTPEKDLKTIIVNQGLVPANQIVLGGRTETFPGDYQLVIRLVTGQMNSRFYYDDFTFSFVLIGQDRNKEGLIADKAWEIHNTLLGGDNILVGDNLYLQFNSQNPPTNSGYTSDNGKPSFVQSMFITRQVQVSQVGGHRIPLSG